MSKTTRLVALFGLILLAFCQAPKTEAQTIFGFGRPAFEIDFVTRQICRSHCHSQTGQSPLLAVARGYLGFRKFTRQSGPWCRDFINVVAARAGYQLANHSRLAIDAIGLGRRVSTPRPGDLVVMRHHITIFAGWSGRRLVGLGGNQSHRVKYSRYPRSRVRAFVRL